MSLHASEATDTVVLIPIRSFDDAKSRLAGVLTPHQRRELAMSMAAAVVAAAGNLPVWIVSDDSEVADWARSMDAEALAVDRKGLTESINAAVSTANAQGFNRAIIAHADLPHASDLAVVSGSGVAIAPDGKRDGSNVMSVPTDAGFRFAYGPGSFDLHLAEAARLGLPVKVVDAPDLAWDVDDPDDLPVDWADTLTNNEAAPHAS